MDTLLTYVVNYWYAILLVLSVSAHLVLLKQRAKSKAKTIALKYVYAGEKLATTTTRAKLAIVAPLAYNALPKSVKVFVNQTAFYFILDKAMEEVQTLVDHLHADEHIPLQK